MAPSRPILQLRQPPRRRTARLGTLMRLRITRRVMRNWPGDGMCLRQALVAGHRIHCLDPTLRIGVARDTSTAERGLHGSRWRRQSRCRIRATSHSRCEPNLPSAWGHRCCAVPLGPAADSSTASIGWSHPEATDKAVGNSHRAPSSPKRERPGVLPIDRALTDRLHVSFPDLADIEINTTERKVVVHPALSGA